MTDNTSRHKPIFALLALLAAAIGFAAPAAAQDKMELRTVTDGVYMMQNDRGSSNATFVITDEGVVVLDADLRTADQVLAQIRKMTDKKVKYLITSHSAGQSTRCSRISGAKFTVHQSGMPGVKGRLGSSPLMSTIITVSGFHSAEVSKTVRQNLDCWSACLM